MNLSKQVKNIGMLAAVGAASVLTSTALNAATLTVLGGDQVIDGDVTTSFTIDLVATGLDLTTTSAGIGVRFDTNVVSFVSGSIDPYWNIGPNTLTPAANEFELYGSSLGSLFGSPVSEVEQGIGSITFDVVAAGDVALEFYSLGAIGDWGYTIADPVPNEPVGAAYCLTLDSLTCENAETSVPANLQILLDPSNITVTTAVVPVPAAVWLFGSGLIGLVAVSRRKAA